MGEWKKWIHKLVNGTWYPFYHHAYDRKKLNENLIFLESRGGKAVAGNICEILKELQEPEYQRFELRLSARKEKKAEIVEFLRRNGLSRVSLVQTGSVFYYRTLAEAGYLVNDTTFPGRFIKKEGQIYLNTWHGTPLKKMGCDVEEGAWTTGNVMRNLLCSDYLLYPNIYMEEKMLHAYGLEHLYKGAILHCGYPRNSVFLKSVSKEIQSRLKAEGKKVFAYMPTWRGKEEKNATAETIQSLQGILAGLDNAMREDEVCFVNLHPFVQDIVKDGAYRHLRPFPREFETYAVLNAMDALVTDYSSVFYDFAVSGKPIVLYMYDKEQYEAERGLYPEIESYPFPITKTAEETMETLRKGKDYDDSAFRKECCSYESADAVQKLCRHVFLDEQVCETERLESDGKPNILIYAGDLNLNGITTALLNLLKELEPYKEACHLYISFRRSSLAAYPGHVSMLPDWVTVYPLATDAIFDTGESVAHALYMRFGVDVPCIRRIIEKTYKREVKKHFCDAVFDSVVHYNGYEAYIIALLMRFDCPKTIVVHNDMVREIATRGIQNPYLLKDAYRRYDYVALVSEDIKEPTVKICGQENNICMLGNCHDFERVLRRAEEPISFQKSTRLSQPEETVHRILNSDREKFITIGRFSKEKGHKRLLEAFHQYRQKQKNDTVLFIIGGGGDLYDETRQYVEEIGEADHVVLIYAVENPMPILKRCQLFLLSSYYEGLGLVILEADTLGIPVVCTDVEGPRGFMKEHGGYLVEDSTEGLVSGMEAYGRGQVPVMHVDYRKMNKETAERFLSLIDIK